MGCPRELFELPFTVQVPGTGTAFVALGDPFPIAGASSVDFALTVSNLGANARAVPALALIVARKEVMSNPTAASGAAATAAGTTHHSSDLSATTDKFLAQAGMIVDVSTGSAPSWVTGMLRATLSSCARVVGVRSIEVPGSLSTSDPTYYVLGRTPAASANKLRASLVMVGSKDVEYRWLVRGVNDPQAPDAWVALGVGYTSFSDGNSATCFADTSVSAVTPGNYHQLDLGLALRKKSGGSAPAGQLRATSALSYT